MEYNNLEEADDDIKWGEIYEIDHAHLPPTATAHLHRIRAARVWKKTATDIEVRFPSLENLNTFVYGKTKLPHPALHEKYVMDLALATKVLVRQVPALDLIKNQHIVEWWLISEMEAEKRKEEAKIKVKESNDNLNEGKTEKPKLDLLRKDAHLVREETAQVETEETVTTRREKVLRSIKIRDGSFQTITWPKLSAEVRKKLADTGLLDHIPGFKRRHNPDGTMEYWVDLESAELVNLIKTRDDDESTARWKPSGGFRSSDPFLRCKSTDPADADLRKPCDSPVCRIPTTNVGYPPVAWKSSDNRMDDYSPVFGISRDNPRKPFGSPVFGISSDNPTDWRKPCDSPSQDHPHWYLPKEISTLRREKQLLEEEVKMLRTQLQQKQRTELLSTSLPSHDSTSTHGFDQL